LRISHFSYRTIERGYDREPVNKILDEIVVITNESVEGKETTFPFDGTGFSASNKENYADKRQKQNSKKNHKKSKSASKDDEPHHIDRIHARNTENDAYGFLFDVGKVCQYAGEIYDRSEHSSALITMILSAI
jgi:transposase